jgi:hypothetical protein
MNAIGSRLLQMLSAATAARLIESRALLRVGFPFWLRPFLLRGVVGITLGKRIYLAPAMLSRRPEELEALLRHEIAHVRQVARLGLIRFLVLYARDYLRLRRSGLSPHQAYASIPFEVEAASAERET